MGNWWIVMLPGEAADMSEFFGPFRSVTAAQEVADRWNCDNKSDEAQAMPISPARDIANVH